MNGKQQEREWAIFNKDNHDYYFLLNEESLAEISKWGKIETTLYYQSRKETIDNIEKETKKELTINLLSEEERKKEMTNAIINQNMDRINIKISNQLIKNILMNERDHYEYRYNGSSDKMHFYIKDSLNKEYLKEIINDKE